MSPSIEATLAPLVYLTAAAIFFFGVKLCARRASARRGTELMVAGLVLALAGAGIEAGGEALLGTLPFAIPGVIVGAIAASRSRASAPAATLGWLFALSGAAVVLFCGVALQDAALPPIRVFPTILAGGLGLVAAAVGALVSFGPRPAVGADARLAAAASLAGWACALLGAAQSNLMLIVAGAVTGAGGIALARSVGAAAGRSPLKLLAPTPRDEGGREPYRGACDVEDAASVLGSAQHIVLMPGYGMAAAQAQHALNDMAALLEKHGASVRWVVHPSAGIMPGHMNIVLDEAGVPHDHVLELSEADEALRQADVVVIVGASDIVNPAATTDPASPLWGMAVPDLTRVPSILAIKRTLGPGQSGIPNAIFDQPNISACFGDAKRVAQALLAELKRHAHA